MLRFTHSAKIFVRKAKQKEGYCSVCQQRVFEDYNYCLRCGSRFIGFIQHLKIMWKYHRG